MLSDQTWEKRIKTIGIIEKIQKEKKVPFLTACYTYYQTARKYKYKDGYECSDYIKMYNLIEKDKRKKYYLEFKAKEANEN